MKQNRWKQLQYCLYLFLGVLLLVCGCSSKKDSIEKDGSNTPISLDRLVTQGSKLRVTLLETEDDSLLTMDSDSLKLYYIPQNEVLIVDEDQQEIDATSLSSGMTLEVAYDHTMPQTDPIIVESVHQLTVTDEKPMLLSAYYDIITQIASEDTVLNKDISMVALDLSEATNLSEEEKTTLTHLIGYYLDANCFLSTYEQLVYEGMIDEEQQAFSKGILIKVAITQEKSLSFTFSVSKWRSLQGAIGYSDCIARQEENYWSYEYKHAWIS